MDEVKTYLLEREQEIFMHLDLLLALERRSQEVQDPDDTLTVNVRQVLILKASILVHLYNVVESIMAKSLEVLERAVHNHHPKEYTVPLFDQWVVTNIGLTDEINVSKLNTRAQIMGRELISSSGWQQVVIKKTDGNWDDKRILKLCKKFGIRMRWPRGLRPRVFQPYFNELTAMQYIRQRRNDLAHGFITFEHGADGKTHADLDALAKLTLKFIKAVVDSYDEFIRSDGYLTAVA